MQTNKKTLKIKRILLARNLLFVLSIILLAAAVLEGVPFFGGQWIWADAAWWKVISDILNRWFYFLLASLAMTLMVILILNISVGRLRKEESVTQKREAYEAAGAPKETYLPTEIMQKPQMQQAVQIGPATFGKAHHIGSRAEQQDSFGKSEVFQGQGILAVVADGMGGLAGGDQVSQGIVMGMLNCAAQLQEGQMDGVLLQMVGRVNEDINQMLGPERLYKSGSTLLAVLADKDRFHWIAVGDSRIYLYREGCLLQVNQEHIQLLEWMPDVLEGKISYGEAVQNPEGKKLTSFIGMGKLRYVDSSLRSVKIAQGDRILLMSDGVFGTLAEQEMADILREYPDVQQAANMFEQKVLAAQMPGQDNFTVVILGF